MQKGSAYNSSVTRNTASGKDTCRKYMGRDTNIGNYWNHLPEMIYLCHFKEFFYQIA